jgi:hypothetical protein
MQLRPVGYVRKPPVVRDVSDRPSYAREHRRCTQCAANDGLRPFVCIGLTRDLPHRSRGMPRGCLNLVRGSAGSCRLRDVCSICASLPLDHDKMHEVNWAHLESLGVTLQAKPSQREGGLDDDADYQTAYQSARKVSVNGGRECPIVASRPSTTQVDRRWHGRRQVRVS